MFYAALFHADFWVSGQNWSGESRADILVTH